MNEHKDEEKISQKNVFERFMERKQVLSKEYIKSLDQGSFTGQILKEGSTEKLFFVYIEDGQSTVFKGKIPKSWIERTEGEAPVTFYLKNAAIKKIQYMLSEELMRIEKLEKDTKELEQSLDVNGLAESMKRFDEIKNAIDELDEKARELRKEKKELENQLELVRGHVEEELEKMDPDRDAEFSNGISLSSAIQVKKEVLDEEILAEKFPEEAFQIIKKRKTIKKLEKDIGDAAFEEKSYVQTRISLQEGKISRWFYVATPIDDTEE